jgi:hypothetical protein
MKKSHEAMLPESLVGLADPVPAKSSCQLGGGGTAVVNHQLPTSIPH